MNKSKDTTDDQFIKQFDNIVIDDGEFMLSPDEDTERQTVWVCGKRKKLLRSSVRSRISI